VFGTGLWTNLDSESLNLNLNNVVSNLSSVTGYLTTLTGAFLPKLLLIQRELSSKSICVIKLDFLLLSNKSSKKLKINKLFVLISLYDKDNILKYFSELFDNNSESKNKDSLWNFDLFKTFNLKKLSKY